MELVPVPCHQKSLTDKHVSSLFLLCDNLARKYVLTDNTGVG